MPQSVSRHPRLFRSSQATVLELWASPDLLRPPWTQPDTSSSFGKFEITSKVTRIIWHLAATCNSNENLTHLLGLEISKPFYLTEGRELRGNPGHSLQVRSRVVLETFWGWIVLELFGMVHGSFWVHSLVGSWLL